MKTMNIFCATVLLVTICCVNCSSLAMKPSQWMSKPKPEEIPSMEEITIEKLEKMPIEKGDEMLEKLYHLSQMNPNMKPNYVPSPSSLPCTIYKPSGKKVPTTLDKLASTCEQQPQFGDQEVTIFITGLPPTTETIRKANRNMVEAYLERNSNKKEKPQRSENSDEKMPRTSSEEDSQESEKPKAPSGDLIVIDLGSKLNNLKRLALLDTEQTGAMIAAAIIDLTEKSDVVDETIHIIGQGIAAHVAGAAGKEYTRKTGRKLRRITALDPSKLFSKDPETLTGLARGDADLVDAIHTNVRGMGTMQRVGNVDFYPNGPSDAVPGAKNTVEASMRATRYFAESVRPGNERNFPAVAARSLKEYKNKNGHGKRVHMGIDTDYDAEGDYILEVNAKSPFGKRAPAEKQNSFHGVHKAWKAMRDDE